MLPLLITPFYAGLLAFIYLGLTFIIIRARYRFKTALGDAQQFEMTRRIRAHANFMEYTPLFLILLSFAEMHRTSAYAIHALGIIFLIGRLFHAYSLIHGEKYADGKLQAYPYWRTAGMLCTFLTIAILAIGVVITYLTYPR